MKKYLVLLLTTALVLPLFITAGQAKNQVQKKIAL